MSFKEKISNIYNEPRPAASMILLIAVIVFFMSRCSDDPTIRVDSKGFADNILVNYGYTIDGQIIVSTPKGKVLRRVKPNIKAEGGPVDHLTSISIAAVSAKNKLVTSSKRSGFMEMIIPSAQATHFQGYGHTYYLYNTIDGVATCDAYDITNYPPSYSYIGPC